MSAIPAPKGWGWRPGAPMFAPAVDRLPDLPLIAQCHGQQRAPIILDSLLSQPAIIRDLRVRDLTHKYGIPQTTALGVLARAARLSS